MRKLGVIIKWKWTGCEIHKTYNKGTYILSGTCRQRPMQAWTIWVMERGLAGVRRTTLIFTLLFNYLGLNLQAGGKKQDPPSAWTVLYCCIDFAIFIYLCSLLYWAFVNLILCRKWYYTVHKYIFHSVWSWATHREVKLNERMEYSKAADNFLSFSSHQM